MRNLVNKMAWPFALKNILCSPKSILAALFSISFIELSSLDTEIADSCRQYLEMVKLY